MARQIPLIEGLKWTSGQGGLFDAAPPKRREINREEYAEGYRDGLAGRKTLASSHVDYLTGHEHGAADRRYKQRSADHAKVFKGWSTLPGQTDFTDGSN